MRRDYFTVQSVQRAMRLLEHLARRSTGFGVTELSGSLNLQKSTVHRLLLTLERCGYVRQEPESGKYTLGLRIFELGRAVPAVDRFRKVVGPHLNGLATRFRETSQFAVLNETDVVFIEKVDASDRVLRLHSDVGKHSPVHCTGLGKAILGFLPTDARVRTLKQAPLDRYTPRTITSLDKLKWQLEVVRRQGYAVDDGEHQDAVRCVAAPVFESDQQVVGAVSLMMVANSVPYRQLPEIAAAVKQTAAALSRELGGVAMALTAQEL